MAAPSGPAPGPLRVIGGGSNGGCIVGAVSLPADGPGFQTIHQSHSAFWGAPSVVAHLQEFARQASAAGLPTLLLEDISNPRGGPMAGGHVSHQIGVDADVALDMRPRPPLTKTERDTIVIQSMVRADGKDTDPAYWSPRVTALLKMAAGLPEVDRVLVNPAIKRHLCHEVTGDRSWLRLIRPWYGHAAHMHIHFRCPEGQAQCVDMTPPPAGDGCDASLDWWFHRPPVKPGAVAPAKPPELPAACRGILE